VLSEKTKGWVCYGSNEERPPVLNILLIDLQHSILLQVLDDMLYLAPLSDDITHVLDIGTGTGIWAIEFADQHPACEITGTDLSSIQPSWVPPNVRFVIDDAEEQWVFNKKFDYVHVHVMIASIRDWPRFVGQGFE
jgi:ubiquinone/menaquinone biosynthesis C-methylase UbiE